MQFSRIQEATNQGRWRRNSRGDSCISGAGRLRLQLNGPLQNGVRSGGYLEFRVPTRGRGLGKLRRQHRLR